MDEERNGSRARVDVGQYVESVKDQYRRFSDDFKQRVRERAIENAEKEIRLRNLRPEDYSEDDLEAIVAEEEQKLWKHIREKPLWLALAAFGIGSI